MYPMKNSNEKDEDTKARLIKAAGEMFVRKGFRSATVREICSIAEANLGAVNYHFRDKEGLYAAVFEYSYQSAIRKYPPGAGLRENASPEEKLQAFIHSFLRCILDEGVSAWYGKLMVRKITDPIGCPGPGAASSMRPLYSYLADILCELLGEEKAADGKESDAVFLCVMSVVGQCLHHFTGRRVIEILCPKSFDPTDIAGIADHVMLFSLGGIQGFRK
jgi:AcrR family transcriptional regulator